MNGVERRPSSRSTPLERLGTHSNILDGRLRIDVAQQEERIEIAGYLCPLF
jgi:hypothetical protein